MIRAEKREWRASRKLSVTFDEKKTDAIFAELNQSRLPGAAVGIAIEGRPVYRKGFGLANMELPVVLSPTIRMRIASMTKQFTCLAFLLLCEEKKARLDDPIERYVPEIHPAMHGITMRQLMGHVSGIRDVFDICHQFSGTGRPVSSADLLSLYRTIDTVNAEPGVTWNYNNGGYLLITAAIERITGQTLEDVFRTRIFDPIGMYDTLLRRYDTEFVPNSAALHMTSASGGFEKSYMGRASDGEGGVVSTIDDMLRWLAHMDTPFIGSSFTWEVMKTPQRLKNGVSTGYGLGLISDRYRGVETLFHSGGLMGCNSQMLKVPEARLDVVIMVNRHDVLGVLLVNKILDACLPDLDPVETFPNDRKFAGTYRSPKTGRVVQLYVKDGEQISFADGWDLQMNLEHDGVLRPISWLRFFQQTVTPLDTSAEPAAIRFSDFENMDELIRVNSRCGADAQTIQGRYRSDETDTSIEISRNDEGVRMKAMGRFGSADFRLESLGENLWRAKSTTVMPWGGILSFDSAAAFHFTTARNLSIAFRRIP